MARRHSAAEAVVIIEKSEVGLKRELKQVEIDASLTELAERRGRVLPVELLAEATATEHPLHKYFEWDDKVASQKYRLSQAIAIILASKMAAVYKQQDSRKVVLEPEPTQVRRMVNAFHGQGFKLRGDVLANTDERAAVIEKKLGILRGWCRETVDIEELGSLRESILQGLASVELK